MKALVSDAYVTESGAYETDRISSPFILGIIRLRIYLPLEMGADTRKLVLAHERYHLRENDSLIKLAARAILLVHWFNPLVWLAYRLMSEDMEMRCDEAVLAELCRGEANDSIRKSYSYALVSMASEKTQMHSSLAFGERKVRRRIMNVLRWKEPRKWLSAVLAAVCLIFVVGCVTNPTGAPQNVSFEERLERMQELSGKKELDALKLMGVAASSLTSSTEVPGSDGNSYTKNQYDTAELQLILECNGGTITNYTVLLYCTTEEELVANYRKVDEALRKNHEYMIHGPYQYRTKDGRSISWSFVDNQQTTAEGMPRFILSYRSALMPDDVVQQLR